MNVDYLHTCRALHARVTRIRYGRAQDLGGGADEFSTMRESFREERTLAELAAEQRVMIPQPMEEMIGAAAELWDDEEDFQRFVEGIRERRIEGRGSVEGNTWTSLSLRHYRLTRIAGIEVHLDDDDEGTAGSIRTIRLTAAAWRRRRSSDAIGSLRRAATSR